MEETEGLRVPRRSILWMLVSCGAGFVGIGALAPVLPLFVTAHGASASLWGAMGAGAGFLMVFTEFGWGWLAERTGLSRPFLVARLGLAAGQWLMLLWPGLAVVFVWQFLDGLFEPTNGVLVRGFVLRSYTPSRRMYGLSLQYVVTAGALAIGAGLGGLLYQAFGATVALALVAAMGTIGVLAGIPLREPPELPRVARPQGAAPAAGPTMLGEGTALLGVAALVQFVGNRLVRAFLVLLATQYIGLSASLGGVLLSVFSLGTMTFTMLCAHLERWMSLQARLVLGLCLCGAGMVTYGLARSFPVLLLAVTVDALGYALSGPPRVVLLGRYCRPEAFSRALGLHGAFENIGVLLGPALGGLLWMRFGPPAAFRVTAVLMAVAVLAALRLRRAPTMTQPVAPARAEPLPVESASG